ncbi:MAG TPA: amidohydrolase family protein [Gemmatimonadaceae bacterium]|nr:amidohydrolase family protein [Gemmatimonadaceae bacterium]
MRLTTLLLPLAAATLACRATTPAPRPATGADASTADLLIRGGTVVDGTGAAPRRADVVIRGDRIVVVGDAVGAGLHAARTIDATGLVVAPGFVDPHTHSLGDLSDTSATRRANLNYLMQGVTTVITGNDGGGPVDVGRRLATWERQGIGTNAALLIGHGSVRGTVLGMQARAPNAGELDSMRTLVARAMDDGALGLSTGLYYAPGSFAARDEVIELAKVAARGGGVYDSHLRDESSYTIGLIGAVTEAIDIAREARIPVNISHIKALGVDVWGMSDSVIAVIRRARAEGLAITADQYPYTASGTGLGAALLPRWAEAGGRDSLVRRIADPATRARLVTEMTENLRRRGGPASLLITSSRNRALVGRTLEQIARERGVSPIEAALQIIPTDGGGVASFNMKESDIETFMVQDFVSTGSDGSDGHPRKYGTFPKKIREYVVAKQLLTLEQAVEASSARTARVFGIADRGVLRAGAFADVIVFDLAALKDEATYEEPRRLAMGMRYVVVNGRIAVDAGAPTMVMAGRALRSGGARP